MSAICSTDAVQCSRASSLEAGLEHISSGQSVEHDSLLAGSPAARPFSRVAYVALEAEADLSDERDAAEKERLRNCSSFALLHRRINR